jgi:hypothetical protein
MGDLGVGAQDHYRTLGVAADAGGHAILRAYAERAAQFPAETHPDTSRRLREAYEALSDAGRRALHDAWRAAEAAELAPCTELQMLRDGLLAAPSRDHLAAARGVLERTVALGPGRDAARRALAAVLLELGEWVAAEGYLRALVLAQPGESTLRCDLARALAGAGRAEEGHAEARRAVELAGADAAAHARAADALALLRRRAEARDALATALRLEGELLPIPALVGRLAGTLILDRDLAAAAATVHGAIAAWAASEDAARRTALTGLAGCAARFFEAGEAAAANQILAACAAADDGCCGGPVPYPVELRREALPPSTRAWIEAQRERPRLLAQYHLPATPYLKRLLACELFLAVFFVSLGARQRCGDPGAWLWRNVVVAAVFLGILVATVRPWFRARYGAFGVGLVLHPQHLLVVEQDRVRVIPLLHVLTLEGSGRGGGTEIAVFTERGKEATGFAATGDAGAVAGRIQREIRRVRAALTGGTLHAEVAAGDFPAALFAPEGLWAQLADLRPLRLLAYAAATVAAATALMAAARPWLCG